jgi:predicted dehydrogenase
MGRRHARAFSQNPRFRLTAVVEPERSRLEEFRKEWGLPQGFHRLEELLAGGPPDVIALCSPSECHFSQMQQILTRPRRPKLLFVEKPICLKAEELDRIQRQTAQAGVTIVVNHTRRFDPAHRRLAEWTRSNRFGPLLEGFCTYYGGWLNNGTHWVDLIRMLFPQEPKVVSVDHAGSGRAGDADLRVELRVGDGAVHLHPVDERRYQIFEAEFRLERGRVRILDFGKQIEVEEVRANPRGERILAPAEGSPWQGLALSMPCAVQAVAVALARQELAGLADLAETAGTMRIVWAAQEMAMAVR